MMEQVPEPAFLAGMAALGLLFGSFANVVIWRFPRGESVVSPGSHCPACGEPVRWHDNIPVISWLLLRGRCRSCDGPISPRYPAVEALSGALWLTAAVAFGTFVQTVVAAFFFWTLLVLTFIDLDTMRLPNPIVGGLAVLGGLSAAVGQLSALHLVPLTVEPGAPVLLLAAIGALLGGGLSGAVAAAYALVRGRSGFGMGDVKLLGAMGIFLGPYVLLALMIGSMAGAAVGVASAVRSGAGMGAKIPFGPFLALGAVVTALVGPDVVGWYLTLTGIS